ncbi:MAG TPA: hypothetical protein VMT64_07585 [Candidatus Binataceae bacterium]|nr:hypothetical protein [Candidatus Binataceae bacterium]
MDSSSESSALPQFVELMALVYHEGRNVSRIFHLNAASTRTFGKLAELPPDDAKAWELLIPAQQRAAGAASAKDAEAVLRDDFGCSLDEIGKMFEHQAWRRFPQYGGPRWAAIAKAVGALRDAIDAKDGAATARLIGEITALRHNTGSIEHKLSRLKARPK